MSLVLRLELGDLLIGPGTCDHLDEEDVDGLVEGRLAADRLTSLATHAGNCGACTELIDDVEMYQKLTTHGITIQSELAAYEKSSARIRRRLARSRGLRRLRTTLVWLTPAVAAVVVALLGVGGALWKLWIPPLERRVATLESQLERSSDRMEELQTALAESQRALSTAQDWTGPVQPGLILGPRRSAEEGDAAIHVGPDQPFVVLTIDVGLSDASRPFRAEIFRGTEEVVHVVEMPASSLRPLLRSGGFLSLLVPATKLPSGEYSLRWIRVEPDREIVDRAFLFRIERDP
jgi:hypothetical protein